MSELTQLPKLPAYSSAGFVNREDEINLVRQRLEELLDRHVVEKRTFIFTGQHGIGKSWFLLHLYHQLQSLHEVKVQHVDLAHYARNLTPQAALLEIVAKISKDLLAETTFPNTAPDAAASFLLTAIREQILQKNILVVLIDTVYESPRQLLAILEDYLLGPLAIESKVLMVLAGRGREYPWSTPELRLQAEFRTLELFGAGTTAQQLQRHTTSAFRRAQAIYDISRGNPKTTLLLAANEDPTAVLDQVIDEMLPPALVSERQLMRQHLEAIAVVRGFDYGHLPHLLSAYYHDENLKRLPRRDVRLILDRLLEPGLIYWNTHKLAYTLHEAMRNLIYRYLRHAQFALWQQLHFTCVDIYQSWVDVNPTNVAQWQKELDYHLNELADRNNLDSL